MISRFIAPKTTPSLFSYQTRAGTGFSVAAGAAVRANLPLISQKSELAEAIRHAPLRWEKLTRFIYDGRVELDNNTVEPFMAAEPRMGPRL
jgi:hypothetical protein